MTKHYYIESDHIASKIGGGMELNIVPLDTCMYAFDIEDIDDYKDKSDANSKMMYHHFDSTHVEDEVLVEANFDWLNYCANNNDFERDIYFYHKDHLGSSTQITDRDAAVIHHIEYMPSGEQFLEQRDRWGTSYKFNGKELDAETGLYYYGARYYNPNLSIWASVDPKSDDYPHQSPFMFCSGNPVARVDMDGMNDYEWEVLQKNDGSIKISKISDLGGEKSQIIHFSKENESGNHIKTANTIVINNTVENIKNYQERKLIMESYNSLSWGEKKLLNFYLLFVTDVNFYSDYLGGPEGENVSASDKLSFWATTYSISIFIGGIKMNKEAFHKNTKPKILNKVGQKNYSWKVGKNPNINVKNGNIILEGVEKKYRGKTFPTTLKASDYLIP